MSNLIKFQKRILKTNVVYCADNLEVMKQLPSESIDLIYIDPPFGKNAARKSRAWDDQVQGLSFYESWGKGIYSYVNFMKDRLWQMKRLLKPTGSIYVHLDWKSAFYIKVEMDKIFGENRFLNDIIWVRGDNKGGKAKGNKLARNHDILLFYSKTKNYFFRKPFKNYSKEYIKSRFKHNDNDGKDFYCDQPINGIPEKTLKKMRKENRIWVNSKGKERKKLYLNESNGVALDDVWTDIPEENSMSKNRCGYPTQKPLALLERIIKSSTNKGDIVADFFCGCATTLSAAQSLGRYWVGVDASKDASVVIRKRMLRDHNLKVDITPLKNLTERQAKSLDAFEFEKYCVRCVGGIPNDKQRGDGGLDGYLIEDGTPIQVKKSENIGRPVIDSFYKHLKKNGRGVIIALSFGSGAKEEAMKLKLEGYDLKLWTLKQILSEGTQIKTGKAS